MALTTPLINGLRYDFSSIEFVAGSKRIVGLKSIDYNHSLEPGLLRGTAAPVLGRTRGQYNAEGTFEAYKEDFDDFLTALLAQNPTLGFMEAAFDINVMYAEASTGSYQSDIIKGVRIKKTDNSHQQGNEGLTVKVDFHAMYILPNGKPPLSIPQTFTSRF